MKPRNVGVARLFLNLLTRQEVFLFLACESFLIIFPRTQTADPYAEGDGDESNGQFERGAEAIVLVEPSPAG